jgi:hypothetical protein
MSGCCCLSKKMMNDSPFHLLLIEIMIRNSHSAYALMCCILSHIDKIKQNLFTFKSLHESH